MLKAMPKCGMDDEAGMGWVSGQCHCATIDRRQIRLDAAIPRCEFLALLLADLGDGLRKLCGADDAGCGEPFQTPRSWIPGNLISNSIERTGELPAGGAR